MNLRLHVFQTNVTVQCIDIGQEPRGKLNTVAAATDMEIPHVYRSSRLHLP